MTRRLDKRYKFGEIMMLRAWISAVTIASISSVSFADDSQTAMMNRVSKFISTYADEINLSHDFVSYCLIEMNIHTEHKADGSVPYGINYNTAPKTTIDSAIQLREIYEKRYIQLCLADAKAKLSSAHR